MAKPIPASSVGASGNKWPLILIGAMLVPLTVAIVAWLWGRPWITSDTATGLIAWNSWRAGGPWNCLLEPDPANLARDVASWVSWWSPGQYVWPGLFLAFDLPLGAALLASSLVAAWIRTTGFFLLLRKLDVSPMAAAAAVFAEAANWQLFSSFGMYIGGEVVQAALLPWLLLAIALLRSCIAWWPVAIPVLLFSAAFAKHTLFLAALGALAWLWWETNLKRPNSWRKWTATALLLAACVLTARLAVTRWIIGPGPTPGDPGQVAHGWMLAIGYPLFAPFSSATGFGSVLGRAFAIAGTDVSQAWQRLGPFLVAAAPLSIFLYVFLAQCICGESLRRLFITFTALYLALFAFLFLRGASVSIEDRHFRPAGMVLIAAIAAIAVDSTSVRRWVRHTLLVALIASSAYGLASVAARVTNLHRLARVAPSGIMQPNLSPAAAAELVRRDAQGASRDQVIVFCDPCIALELRHSRCLLTDALDRPLAWFQARHWHGRVPHLLLVLPAAWVDDPRTAALRRCFPIYSAGEWRSDVVGDTLFISAGD